MTGVNFTEWTESDPQNKLEQTTVRSTWTDVRKDEDNTHLSDDFGIDYFDSFVHPFDLCVTSITQSADQFRRLNCITYSEGAVGDFHAVRTGQHEQLTIAVQNPNIANKFYLKMWETKDGTVYGSGDSINFDVGTTYYCKLVKNGTSVTLYIYSDADRTNLLGSISHTLQGDYTFQYIMCPQSFDDAVNEKLCSGYVENLDIELSLPQAIKLHLPMTRMLMRPRGWLTTKPNGTVRDLRRPYIPFKTQRKAQAVIE